MNERVFLSHTGGDEVSKQLAKIAVEVCTSLGMEPVIYLVDGDPKATNVGVSGPQSSLEQIERVDLVVAIHIP